MAKRIAVVEDDVGTSLFFKICLEDQGHLVDTFYDPLTFLDQFHPGTYSLLISDIRMPGINGFELARKIKSIDTRIGVCLTTAFEEFYSSIIKSYKDLDLSCLIKKPVSNEALLETVKNKFDEIEK